MDFDWSSRTVAEWRDYLKKVPRANWLQSLPYAKASRLRDQKSTRLALLRLAPDQNPVGMVAIQEIKLGPIHVLNLYRGPLWFSAQPPQEWFLEFAKLFNRTYPRRLLRRRRWLPEWPNTNQARELLSSCGFKLGGGSYETIWLNLRESESWLRQNLKQKWRNALNKSERSHLKTSIDAVGKSIDLFLAFYQIDRSQKKYRSRDINFVREEFKAALVFREALIFWAHAEGKPVAGILVFINGKSGTYRVGWTTEEGRKHNAHNLLLWEAIKHLKAKNLESFDLGGIEPNGAEGLSHFKQGLGGDDWRLVGIFR